MKVSEMGLAPMMNQQGSALMVLEKKVDLESARGKLIKNRNETYVKENGRKNTQSKIKKEVQSRVYQHTGWVSSAKTHITNNECQKFGASRDVLA